MNNTNQISLAQNIKIHESLEAKIKAVNAESAIASAGLLILLTPVSLLFGASLGFIFNNSMTWAISSITLTLIISLFTIPDFKTLKNNSKFLKSDEVKDFKNKPQI